MFCHLQGASKMKMKNANKKRTVTARRLIFWEFLKASIADLISLLFSSLQNSEGSGDSDRGDSCADNPPPPPNFYHFGRPKSLSASLLHFWDFWQKICRNKNRCNGQREENQSKKYRKKTFISPAMTRQQFFTKICQLWQKSAVFLPLLRLGWYAMSKHIFLMSCLNRFRSTFSKNTIFMPLYGHILQVNFFDLKNSINRQINSDLEPLKYFGINIFGSYHPLIYWNISEKKIKQEGHH